MRLNIINSHAPALKQVTAYATDEHDSWLLWTALSGTIDSSLFNIRYIFTDEESSYSKKLEMLRSSASYRASIIELGNKVVQLKYGEYSLIRSLESPNGRYQLVFHNAYLSGKKR